MHWLTRILAVAILVICVPVALHAGGPAFIAGAGFAPGVEGQALIWANGSVQYFTDQGNLSPILAGSQADALVATAFSAWTAVPGTLLTAAQAGHLAEDVNGSNIETDGFGIVTGPADITSSATGNPIGIVYDYDGAVTDALFGEGAGGLDDCFTNTVYGGPDNFTSSGNIAHALVVINGVCASVSTQLPDVQYRLIRVLGRILGLGWSQVNVNVQTRNPTPTAADFAGFPVMHFTDSLSCVPISLCYPNAAVPKMDDMDALLRLYPGSSQATGRIYGSVYFTDANGNVLQPMQGVNVVARLLVLGIPSDQYTVTSVSGFLFCGNAGNIIDGYLDGGGLPYDRWGSDVSSLEGFFDLGQLMIPVGQSSTQYQLSVEALDPHWSLGVGPYAPTQVTPSGSFAPVTITIQSGSNVESDIWMLRDEVAREHPGSGSTYTTPAALPQDGAWGSWLSGYGSVDFFQFAAQANRTASISVTALDETGQPTEIKLQPVIGIWQLSDESGDPAPASTTSAFNTPTWGVSRLDAEFGETDTYRLAVADFRGDGRPDYFYQARLLYSDSVTPARIGLAGGVATLQGIGFNAGLQVSVNGSNISKLSASANQILVNLPTATIDGTASIQVTDPVSGGFSQMAGALSYGALASDTLQLLQSSEPTAPVGAAAANAIRVRAVAADGITPVSGATIAWTGTNGLQFSICGGATSCSVLSDGVGESSSWISPEAAGQSTITISLAPESYSPPQSQLVTITATESAADLAAIMPTRWVAQGATVALPLTVEALDLGVPQPNVIINFAVTKGAAALSSNTAETNGLGLATITANLANQSVTVQVSACVAPNNSPCQSFVMLPTAPSLWTLQTISGSSQAVTSGQSFQPLVVRVTDGSIAANPVLGVSVAFSSTLAWVPSGSTGLGGESPGGGNPTPVILGSSQALMATDQNGLASILPSAQNVGPCDVFIAVTAGAATAQFQLENLAAIVSGSPKEGVIQPPAAEPIVNFSRTTPPPPSTTPALLFAVPQGVASPEPVAETPEAACPSLASEVAPVAQDGSPTGAATGNHSAPTNCAVTEPAAPVTANKAVLAKSDSPAKATRPRKGHLKASLPPWLPADKRSCRGLAGDSLFFGVRIAE